LSWRRKCLEIREKLAASDPANIQWQRDLSVNYEKIGIAQDRSRNLETGKAGLGPEWTRGARPKRPPLLHPPLTRS
jgi:hypothetical protein